MPRTIPERYVWAVEILDVQPADVILEIGCGYGHSIALICDKLSSGRLTAIDRSEKMVAAAALSNKEAIATNRVSVLHQDLLHCGSPTSYFDKIFFFNINVFWMDPVAELAEIRRLLKPTGRLFLFHQPPPDHYLDEFESAFRHNLEKNEFTIVDRFRNDDAAVGSLGLVAEPNPQ